MKSVLFSYKKSKGVSLIEILIVLFVTNILFLTIASFWSTQRKIMVEEVKNTQRIEKEQLMVHLLGLPLRMVGYIGCRSFYDDISIEGLHDTIPLKGFSEITLKMERLPVKIKTIPNSDILFMRSASFPAGVILEEARAQHNEVWISKMEIQEGDSIIISDCMKAEVATVKMIKKNDKSIILQLAQPLIRSYAVQNTISVLEQDYFYLAETQRKDDQGRAIIALYKHPINKPRQELIEGIEQLKFAFSTKENDVPHYIKSENIKNWREVNKVKMQIQITDSLFSTEMALRNAK